MPTEADTRERSFPQWKNTYLPTSALHILDTTAAIRVENGKPEEVEVENGETLGVERQNNQLQPVLYPKVVRILRFLENVP